MGLKWQAMLFVGNSACLLLRSYGTKFDWISRVIHQLGKSSSLLLFTLAKTELTESKRVYSGDGLWMAGWSAHTGEEIADVQVSQDMDLFESIAFTWKNSCKCRPLGHDTGGDTEHSCHWDPLGQISLSLYGFTWKMVLKLPFTSHTGEDCTFTVQVSQETEPFESVVILGRWSWNGHLSGTLGKKLCTFIVQVSQKTDLLLVHFCWEAGLEMIVVITLEKRHCTFFVKVSQHKELFWVSRVIVSRCLEMVQVCGDTEKKGFCRVTVEACQERALSRVLLGRCLQMAIHWLQWGRGLLNMLRAY